MIAASIGISLLGAFTSTQLMCQAKTSRHFAGRAGLDCARKRDLRVLLDMELARGRDARIRTRPRVGIDVALPILNAVLAVIFTFVALASDMLYDRYARRNRKIDSKSPRRRKPTRPDLSDTRTSAADEGSLEPLLPHPRQMDGNDHLNGPDLERAVTSYPSEPQQRPSMVVIQDTANKASAPGGHLHQEEATSMKPAPLSLSYRPGHAILAETSTAR